MTTMNTPFDGRANHADAATPRRLRWAEQAVGGVAFRAGLAALPFTGLAWVFVAH